MYPFEQCFPPDICPGVGFLDHTVALFLVFEGTAILFSRVAVPMYIPTNSVGGFPFLHTLSSIYCCRLLFLFYFRLHWVFVAVRGLFSSCSKRGPLFVVVRRLLIAVAPLVAEHGL